MDTTLTVYTQVVEGSLRAAMETIGQELFTHCSQSGGAGDDRAGLTH